MTPEMKKKIEKLSNELNNIYDYEGTIGLAKYVLAMEIKARIEALSKIELDSYFETTTLYRRVSNQIYNEVQELQQQLEQLEGAKE